MEETISSFGTFASPVKPNSRLGDFKILSRLGEGAFSTVYKVERQTDKRVYAMKKVRLGRLSEKEKASALNEIRILASIRSRHVIEYRDSFFDESSDSLCIIMEFAVEGDLLTKLNALKLKNKCEQELEEENDDEVEQSLANKQTPQTEENQDKQITQINQDNESNKSEGIPSSSLEQSFAFPNLEMQQQQQQEANQKPITKPKYIMNEETIWEYLRQTTEGLRCLHGLGILHRDLKCANLFLSHSNTLKIGDLNVSIVTRPSKSMAKTQTGTPYYTAPEIWRGHAYSTKSDIWSIGCIAYELAAQIPPFSGATIERLFMNILCGSFARIPTNFSYALATLITRCLAQDPDNRPSCEEVLSIIELNHHHHIASEKPQMLAQQNKKSTSQIELVPASHGTNNRENRNSNTNERNLEVKVNSFNSGGMLENNNIPKTPVRNHDIQLAQNLYLIDTINVPSNMKQLSGLLPQPNYADEILRASVEKPPHVLVVVATTTGTSLPQTTEFNTNFYGMYVATTTPNKKLGGAQIVQKQSKQQQQYEQTSLNRNPTAVSENYLGDSRALIDSIEKIEAKENIQSNDANTNTPRVRMPLQFDAGNSTQRIPLRPNSHTNIENNNNNRNVVKIRREVYHDLINDSPIRMNLKRVPMDQELITRGTSKSFMQQQASSPKVRSISTTTTTTTTGTTGRSKHPEYSSSHLRNNLVVEGGSMKQQLTSKTIGVAAQTSAAMTSGNQMKQEQQTHNQNVIVRLPSIYEFSENQGQSQQQPPPPQSQLQLGRARSGIYAHQQSSNSYHQQQGSGQLNGSSSSFVGYSLGAPEEGGIVQFPRDSMKYSAGPSGAVATTGGRSSAIGQVSQSKSLLFRQARSLSGYARFPGEQQQSNQNNHQQQQPTHQQQQQSSQQQHIETSRSPPQFSKTNSNSNRIINSSRIVGSSVAAAAAASNVPPPATIRRMLGLQGASLGEYSSISNQQQQQLQSSTNVLQTQQQQPQHTQYGSQRYTNSKNGGSPLLKISQLTSNVVKRFSSRGIKPSNTGILASNNDQAVVAANVAAVSTSQHTQATRSTQGFISAHPPQRNSPLVNVIKNNSSSYYSNTRISSSQQQQQQQQQQQGAQSSPPLAVYNKENQGNLVNSANAKLSLNSQQHSKDNQKHDVVNSNVFVSNNYHLLVKRFNGGNAQNVAPQATATTQQATLHRGPSPPRVVRNIFQHPNASLGLPNNNNNSNSNNNSQQQLSIVAGNHSNNNNNNHTTAVKFTGNNNNISSGQAVAGVAQGFKSIHSGEQYQYPIVDRKLNRSYLR